MLIGSVSVLLAEKVAPAKLRFEMTTDELLSLTTVTPVLTACPTGTDPKSTVLGVIWRLPRDAP
jgi:hypothetical protein